MPTSLVFIFVLIGKKKIIVAFSMLMSHEAGLKKGVCFRHTCVSFGYIDQSRTKCNLETDTTLQYIGAFVPAIELYLS